jgi:HEPN domain-containing protein
MTPLDPLNWFHKANRDLGLAKLAQLHTPDYPDLICYHCQQASEKYLKALAAAEFFRGFAVRILKIT